MDITEVEKQLFLIVGCPRSGTTLCQTMIASHPDVILPDETSFYSRIYQNNSADLGELKIQEFERALDISLHFYRIKELNLNPEIVKAKCQGKPQSWETIFLAILATYAEQHNAKRVGEKSPRHFAYVGLLKERFSNAKFIHVIRDPRATVLSLMKAPFGSNKIGNSCNLWQSAIKIHQQYAEELGAERYKAIKYEDLVCQPEETLREICKFLNLEFSLQMLNFDRRKELGFNKRYIKHMSNTLKPLFTSSINTWQKELTNTQIAIIQNILAEEMRLLDYQPLSANTLLPYAKYKIDVWSETLNHKIRKFKNIFS